MHRNTSGRHYFLAKGQLVERRQSNTSIPGRDIPGRSISKAKRTTVSGEGPGETIARYMGNIQLIVYHGTVAALGRLRSRLKAPFVGQRRYNVRCPRRGVSRGHTLPLPSHDASSTYLWARRPLPDAAREPPTQQIRRIF